MAKVDVIEPVPRSVFVISATIGRVAPPGAGRLLARLVPDRFGVLARPPLPGLRRIRVVGPSAQGSLGSLVRGLFEHRSSSCGFAAAPRS